MNKIAESELIINDRGAVYHLDLRPEEIAHTIFTVGDPGRVAQVSKHFDSIEHRSSHREFITHTGYIGKKRLSVISSGIGTDNIDIVLNELDALVNVDFESRMVKPELTQLQIMRIVRHPNIVELKAFFYNNGDRVRFTPSPLSLHG